MGAAKPSSTDSPSALIDCADAGHAAAPVPWQEDATAASRLATHTNTGTAIEHGEGGGDGEDGGGHLSPGRVLTRVYTRAMFEAWKRT